MPDNNKPLSPQGYLIGMLPIPDNPFWGDLPEGGHGLPPGRGYRAGADKEIQRRL